MPTAPQTDVTRLLQQIEDGDASAKKALFELIYEELRRMARGMMATQQPRHTLQATALVHECYFRLRPDDLKGRSRAFFFGAAARAMRQILVDHDRKRKAAKRGGDWKRVPLDQALDTLQETQGVDILQLHQALEELEILDPRQREVVELRFFAGLTLKEIADQLGVSLSKVEKEWRSAL